MRIRNTRMNLFDAVDREDVSGRLARELVGPVLGSDRDRESIDAGAMNEVSRLLRIREQLIAA